MLRNLPIGPDTDTTVIKKIEIEDRNLAAYDRRHLEDGTTHHLTLIVLRRQDVEFNLHIVAVVAIATTLQMSMVGVMVMNMMIGRTTGRSTTT